jgi:hypothetical protein
VQVHVGILEAKVAAPALTGDVIVAVGIGPEEEGGVIASPPLPISINLVGHEFFESL